MSQHHPHLTNEQWKAQLVMLRKMSVYPPYLDPGRYWVTTADLNFNQISILYPSTPGDVGKAVVATMSITIQRNRVKACHGTKEKPNFVPPELLTVLSGQQYARKLDEKQIKAITNFAVRPPAANARRIVEQGAGGLWD
ncbi:MAG: hypothetical protein Q9218_002874 [Villophora microphyllina]